MASNLPPIDASPLPPVPVHTKIVALGPQQLPENERMKCDVTWMNWFNNLVVKINVIDSFLVTFSKDGTTGTGIPVFNGSGAATFVTFTTGDILYGSASNTLTALSIGVTGMALTVSGGLPKWRLPGDGAVYTVATLPGAAGSGARAVVTDATLALAAGIGTVVVGGGANTVPVVKLGANWTIG